MTETEFLAAKFEEQRAHLRGVAYRMLGSLSDADDAVQQAWFRLSRMDADAVENLRGWLTTVVARIALDMLRQRESRREEPMDATAHERASTSDPEEEAVLADSVGLALLVVLDTLPPAERLAFVLHDLFAMPFEQVAPIVQRTPEAARQLASRARRRVQGADTVRDRDLDRQREIVEAFLAAARRGDFEALLGLLDPDVVLRTDRSMLPPGAPAELRGARIAAERAVRGGARAARLALIDGSAGLVVAPRGRLMMLLRFTFENGKITMMEAIADPERVRDTELAILE